MKKKDFAHQVDSFDYRGFHFDVYSDPAEQQFFTFYKNELVELGIMNQNYLRYIKSLVDFDMDVIEMFSGELVGAKLEWFQNSGNRDIKLTYLGRILKIWLVEEAPQVELEKIISEAKRAVKKVIKLNSRPQ